MNRIYTAGYSGRTPQQLKQAAEQMDAVVCDIRRMPRSRMAGWNESELEAVLGQRYYRVPEWGNVNYQTGQPAKLFDEGPGLHKVLKVLERNNAILLCGCREYFQCHRRLCAEILESVGHSPQELEWPASPLAQGKVRCISLWQPWSTPYRGPLLIHAAKTMQGIKDLCDELPPDADHLPSPFDQAFRGTSYRTIGDLPFGALVCVVNLVDCVPTEQLVDEVIGWERAFGNYEPKRFGWLLQNVRRFPKPIPLRGQQGMWDVEIDLEAALRGEV